MLLQCQILVLNDAKASHNEVHVFGTELCRLFHCNNIFNHLYYFKIFVELYATTDNYVLFFIIIIILFSLFFIIFCCCCEQLLLLIALWEIIVHHQYTKSYIVFFGLHSVFPFNCKYITSIKTE